VCVCVCVCVCVWREREKVYTSLISALNRVEWSVSLCGHFTNGDGVPSTCWMFSTTGLRVMASRKVTTPSGNWTPFVQPVASRYIDWAVRAHWRHTGPPEFNVPRVLDFISLTEQSPSRLGHFTPWQRASIRWISALVGLRAGLYVVAKINPSSCVESNSGRPALDLSEA
jgi:hypothetical protein